MGVGCGGKGDGGGLGVVVRWREGGGGGRGLWGCGGLHHTETGWMSGGHNSGVNINRLVRLVRGGWAGNNRVNGNS